MRLRSSGRPWSSTRSVKRVEDQVEKQKARIEELEQHNTALEKESADLKTAYTATERRIKEEEHRAGLEREWAQERETAQLKVVELEAQVEKLTNIDIEVIRNGAVTEYQLTRQVSILRAANREGFNMCLNELKKHYDDLDLSVLRLFDPREESPSESGDDGDEDEGEAMGAKRATRAMQRLWGNNAGNTSVGRLNALIP